MSLPKHYVFDDEGKLTEVRGYKDDVVVERWGIVYDEEDKPVGLKPLPVKEVIPQSMLDRIKFWRKPKPLTQILSIDFIGLIQYIGLINKIKKVSEITNIKNIESIDLIDKITEIGEITTIRDLTWSPRSLIQNPSFEQDDLGWVLTPIGNGSVSIDSVVKRYGKKSLKIVTAGAGAGMASQHFPVPIKTDWFTSLDLYLRASVVSDTIVKLIWVHTDELTTTNTLGVTQEDIFQRKAVTPPADKYIERIYFLTTDTVDCTCYIDGLMVML